jgi:hypothetical protein
VGIEARENNEMPALEEIALAHPGRCGKAECDQMVPYMKSKYNKTWALAK